MIILCVDDDADDVELFCEAVRTIDETYTCVVAKNGQQGLDVLRYLLPDFIFLDVNMPILDGKSTLRIIRGTISLKQLPICMYSTSITSGDIQVFRNMGANHCMVKPNNFNNLCEALKNIFARASVQGYRGKMR